MSLVRKIIKHRSPMQNEKSQPSGQRIMPETRQTSFPALSVDPRAGISPSASETDDRVYFFWQQQLIQQQCLFICKQDLMKRLLQVIYGARGYEVRLSYLRSRTGPLTIWYFDCVYFSFSTPEYNANRY